MTLEETLKLELLHSPKRQAALPSTQLDELFQMIRRGMSHAGEKRTTMALAEVALLECSEKVKVISGMQQ